MSTNQFLAILFFIQTCNAETKSLVVGGLVGFFIFGVLAMRDGFKYEKQLTPDA